MLVPTLRLVFLLLITASVAPAWAESSPNPPTQPASFFDDPNLKQMINEALEKRPEAAQAESSVEASREKVLSAGALPDPMISLGIQNDGFGGIQVGKMETSYVSIMAQQTLPWPGKRGLRSAIQSEVVQQGEADRSRVRLGITAEVRRAYLDLLLVREQLKLLRELESLWKEAEGIARARYETGVGVQADVLRAQLENTRLIQRRWALEAEERRQLEILNRLRAQPFGSPITTSITLAGFATPTVPDEEQAISFAELHSPELARARAAIAQSKRESDLARREYFPDYTLSAALMPRGGPFPSMWQLGVGVSLPLWASQKQRREVAAANARARADAQGADAIQQILRQRVVERLTVLRALRDSWRLYRSGLLVQSSATAQSTMAHYRVGDVTFASVLEALAGYLADANGYYETVVSAEKILIAMNEISLEPPAGAETAMRASPMPGAAGGTGKGTPGMRESSSNASGM